MAWGALVKTVAKGAVKKTATGAIKKKVKGKGKKMAEKMMDAKKEKDDSSSIVVREKSTTLAAPLLGGGDDSSDSSANTSKKSKSPLDRIDSAVKDIMKTLKKRRKLMLNKSRRMRVQADKQKKGKREGLLEKMKTTGKNMVKSAAAGAKGWWERLQTFLLMTLVGSLVVAIKENWEKIKEKIDKVVNFVKDLWKFMEPVLIPLFEGLKWVVKQWTEMGSELMGLSKDKPKVEKETDQLSQDLKELEKKKDWVTGKFKEAEEGVKDYENKTFDEVANEAGLSSEVSPDSEEQPGKTKEQVEAEVGEQITGSDIETKLDEFKSKVEEVNVTPIKVDTSKMKKYETGASPVPETGPAIVHKGEVIIPAHVVKMAGGPMNIENMVNMMQSSTTNIKQNPLKIISIMQGMSKEFAPMGEQIPGMINEIIKESKLGTVSKKVTREMVEKMENTLTVLKEQTEYEDPSASTVIIRVPTSAPQSNGGGGGGKTIAIPVGESGKATLNRYINALTQKALY